MTSSPRWGLSAKGLVTWVSPTRARYDSETAGEGRPINGGLMRQWPERVAVQPRAPGAIRRLQPLFRRPRPPQYSERVDI
jgi:hypothetical protein